MKRLAIVLLLLAGAAGLLAAEEKTVDVVYMKDGSVLRGTIVERQTYPQEAIKLRTLDGLDITIPMDKIQRITKESAGGQEAEAAPGLGEPLIDQYAFEVNLLGFLQFGPFARFHFRVSDTVTVAPHVRVGYAGLIPWVVFNNPDIGVGTSVLTFFPASRGNNRLYAGGFAEVALNYDQNIIVAAGANGGYRFRFPNGRYWNVGGFAGMFYDTYWQELYFFGMVELAWGKEFGRK
jgi:hypothetical protein